MDPIAEVVRIARRQHGLITRAHALAAGITIGQLRTWLRHGHWAIVRPGVYAVAGMPPTGEQAVLAAVLAMDAGAYASHATAAALWGLPVEAPVQIDLVSDLRRLPRLEGVMGHRSGSLFSADLTHRHRVPCTTAERTLVDLSGALAAV